MLVDVPTVPHWRASVTSYIILIISPICCDREWAAELHVYSWVSGGLARYAKEYDVSSKDGFYLERSYV